MQARINEVLASKSYLQREKNRLEKANHALEQYKEPDHDLAVTDSNCIWAMLNYQSREGVLLASLGPQKVEVARKLVRILNTTC